MELYLIIFKSHTRMILKAVSVSIVECINQPGQRAAARCSPNKFSVLKFVGSDGTIRIADNEHGAMTPPLGWQVCRASCPPTKPFLFFSFVILYIISHRVVIILIRTRLSHSLHSLTLSLSPFRRILTDTGRLIKPWFEDTCRTS